MSNRTALLFLLGAAAAAAQPQLALVSPITPVKVWPAGQPIAVSVTLSGSAGQNIAGVQFSLTLPAGAALVAAAGTASTAAQKSVTCGPKAGNTVTCMGVGINSNVYADGDVADLTITIPVSGAVPASFAFVPSGAEAAALDSTAIVTAAGAIATVPLANPCDLTGDGKVDLSDLQAFIAQATGGSACTTGDLVGLGKCDIVSAQRIVDAALGQACKVGQ